MPQQYPPDEFDGITDSDRRGAHREKSARLGGVSSIVFVAIVAVIVVLLGIAVVNVINSGNAGPDKPVVAGPSPTSSSSPSADEKKNSPAPSASKSGSETPGTSTSSAPADVDKSEPLQVLNSTTVAGMAARASNELKSDGWNVSNTGNYDSPVTATTVYYSDSDLKSTAKAIADDLGTGRTKQSTGFATDLTVVLANDFSNES